MTKSLLTTVFAVLALLVARAAAQEQHAPVEDHGKAPAHAEATDAHPVSEDGAHDGSHDAGPVPPHPKIIWPWLVLIGVVTMFVFAAVIGPISRLVAPPEEVPPTHSHDEPPGASHHHGASGIINPEPGQGHSHDHGHH